MSRQIRMNFTRSKLLKMIEELDEAESTDDPDFHKIHFSDEVYGGIDVEITVSEDG